MESIWLENGTLRWRIGGVSMEEDVDKSRREEYDDESES